MAKRKQTNISNLLFDEIDPYAAVVPQQQSAAGESVSYLPLETILPDPYQPRAMLPEELVQRLMRGEITSSKALREWLKLAERKNATPALKEGITELRRLADSLEQHGLINPITVRPVQSGEAPLDITHFVVTGERRFWAHVLLTLDNREIADGHKRYPASQVRANVTAEGTAIRAHQLIENVIREDINVLEKAYGLVALREELTDLRAQAGQGSPDKAVSWGDVEKAIGFSRSYRTRITAALDLSEEAQQVVMNHNLTERAVRPIVQHLRKHKADQLEALNYLLKLQETDEDGMADMVPLEQFVAKLLTRSEDSPKTTANLTDQRPTIVKQWEKQIQTTVQYLAKVPKQIDKIPPDHRKTMLADLHHLRDQIDNLVDDIQTD